MDYQQDYYWYSAIRSHTRSTAAAVPETHTRRLRGAQGSSTCFLKNWMVLADYTINSGSSVLDMWHTAPCSIFSAKRQVPVTTTSIHQKTTTRQRGKGSYYRSLFPGRHRSRKPGRVWTNGSTYLSLHCCAAAAETACRSRCWRLIRSAARPRSPHV